MLAFGRPAILSERRGAEALRAESDSSSLGFFEWGMLAKTSIIMLLLSPRLCLNSEKGETRGWAKREISLLKELVQIQYILLPILVTYNSYLYPVSGPFVVP